MDATIALAGNPNSGKTTLFNELTGARQHVGNYPGVTVQKKQGVFSFQGQNIQVVDLPGTYSLTAYSLEEVVARDFIILEKPALVVNIVDASNLERNLYLSLQFMEMGVPLCIALNMMDVAENRGISVDHRRLARVLGVPIIPTIARNGSGKKELMAAAASAVLERPVVEPLHISYGDDIDRALLKMSALIDNAALLTDRYPSRWVALKFMENDEHIRALGARENPEVAAQLEEIAKKVAHHIHDTLDTYPEAVIADHRYGFIKSIMQQGIISRKDERDRLFLSDRIDKVVTHRLAGPLIMLAVIMGLYQFTFTYSELPVVWLESFFGWLSGRVDLLLPNGLLKSLIISGVIDGVGGVLGFVPLILFMFFGISILEDSGYLARVAFMLDRVFRVFGLHGSSVMPFIVSGGIAGGCAVPGIMATRTLKSPRERLATLLTVPFMNCGAKMPVYALLVAAFFPEKEAPVMFAITLIAWGGALLVARLLRSTVIKGESTPFVMELPPYRFPTLKGLLIHTWERTWQYIRKAGTVILGISIILWAMMTFPGMPTSDQEQFEALRNAEISAAPPAAAAQLGTDIASAALMDETVILKERLESIDRKEAETALRSSIAGRMGSALESVSLWAGFDWRVNIALVGGFAAKEVVVSTLGTAYSLGEIDPEGSESLSRTLATSSLWRPLTAWSLILFIMFYAPCFVSVVCIARESGSWKWGLFSVLFNTVLAFTIAVAVFQTGTLMGF